MIETLQANEKLEGENVKFFCKELRVHCYRMLCQALKTAKRDSCFHHPFLSMPLPFILAMHCLLPVKLVWLLALSTRSMK